jgi:hypothetical protein
MSFVIHASRIYLSSHLAHMHIYTQTHIHSPFKMRVCVEI